MVLTSTQNPCFEQKCEKYQIFFNLFFFYFFVGKIFSIFEKSCFRNDLTETFAVTRKTKANFPFNCDSFQRRVANIPKLFTSCLLAQIKWRPMRINLYMLVCNQKYGNLILNKIDKYWYSLFDLTSSLVYENNGVYSLIAGHMRRIRRCKTELRVHGYH